MSGLEEVLRQLENAKRRVTRAAGKEPVKTPARDRLEGRAEGLRVAIYYTREQIRLEADS